MYFLYAISYLCIGFIVVGIALAHTRANKSADSLSVEMVWTIAILWPMVISMVIGSSIANCILWILRRVGLR